MLELAQTLKGGTARIPQKQAFAARELAGGQSTVSVGYFFKSIDKAKVHVFREDVFADAFGDVSVDFLGVELAGFVVFFKHGTVSVHSPNLDVGVLFFEVLGDSRDGSAGSDAHDEVGDAALSLFPDFGSGRLVVRLAVAQVVVLIGEKAVGDFGVQPARH